MKYFLILISLILVNPALGQNTKVENFSQAKRMLKRIYNKTSLEKKTVYCSCSFKGSKVDLKSCGYKGRVKKGKEQYQKRSSRVEWEHIVPASMAIRAFAECRLPGGKKLSRKKCEKASKAYRLVISDMHNLYPSVGSLNAHRSNYSMAEIPGEKREWGSCDFEISSRKVEPKDDVKGDIARIYKYMDSVYPVKFISNKNKSLFDAWDKLDPVSPEECKRHALIKQYQGNGNPFVEAGCK